MNPARPRRTTDPVRTSARARGCIAVLVAAYLVVALIAAVPNSPLATRLPAGARPPSWALHAARAIGLAAVDGPGLIALSLAVVVAAVCAFILLLLEARANRVRLAAVLAGTALALVISVAAPVLLSRDVFSYAAYARIDAVHHQNPYVAVPIAFRRDPFVADTAAQWLHARSVYGPAFTLASEGIVRLGRHSPNSLILAFKVAAGLGVAMAVACTTLAAKSARPERAPVAAALVGLNPVIVVHTVGGAHVDAWLAGLLAGALALAVRPRRTAFGAGAVTVLLTAASLIKIVALPALALWLWRLARTAPPGRRARAALRHAGLVLVLTAATVAPFADGWRTLTPLATTGGLESWASPAHFVAHGLRGLVELFAGAGAGRFVEFAVLAFFLFGFVAVFIRMARRDATLEPGPAHPAGAWGPALLLLALSLPYLLPWYAAWFVPFLGLLTDGLLMGIGTLVSVLLALTLVPADPFHGTTTPGVMIWVHDVIAPAMLVSLVVAVRRVWKGPAGGGEGHSAAPLGS